jgi:hypothetical protein
MTKEEGSVQLADAAWTPRGACKVSFRLTSLTQAGLAGKLPISRFLGTGPDTSLSH